MAAKKKTATKRATTRKPAARKATTRKTTTRKTTAKKTVRKTVAKKAPAKRATAKKAPATKAVATPVKKLTSVKEAFTKTQLQTTLAEQTGLSKKEVASVLDNLAEIVELHVKKRGPGQFTLPGLFKIVVTHKPAVKARKGINPFTGEETTFKAKPARNVVKIRPLKKLKDMVN